ncbi:DsbA family protein [Iodidimonas sp. SYSU 1G8]|uniref:DsbA family protein n=1 Tax=Iodidimonas sp. SYSU 1G8 TaxID=3133967 RepID=UPI0031FEC0AB
MKSHHALRGIAAAAIALWTLQTAAPALALSERDKTQVEQIVRDYLRNNPQVLEEMITALNAQRVQQAAADAEKAIAENKDIIFADNGLVAGNPQGDVTLVEFFDYRCGYCRLAQPNIVKLLEEDPNIRIVFKEYPVLGPESITASRAAVASAKQGKYVEFHMALMGLEEPLNDDVVYRVAGEVGLDVARLKEDMKSEDIDAMLAENQKLAETLGIGGTPNFIIGSHLLQGLVTYETLTETVEKERKANTVKPVEG